MYLEKYDSVDVLVRLEFEDGYFYEYHSIDYEYEDDFESLLSEHGNITYVYVSCMLLGGAFND